MTDKQIIFKCDVDCIRKNTEECFELDCIKGQESILKQLQAKEQECEELKKQRQADKGLITATGKMNYQLLQEYDKLKTVLTEIKEIAENGKRFAERYMITGEQKANVLTYANAILQKISECEGNND